MSFCLLQSCTAHACIACIFAFVQRFAKKQAPIGTALAPRYCSQHGQCAVSRPSRRIALLCPLFSLPVLSLLLLLGLTQAAVTGVDINRFVMALRSLGSNQYALEEVINAPIGNVFQQLCQLGSQYPLSPLTARLEVLTTHPFGVGSKWQEHRRHLFLRDVMKCEVLQCGPRALSIVSSDGFNQLRYNFELNEVEANTTVLHCTVDCYTRPGGQGQYANPSEKLAIMMQSQDRHAMRQLKGVQAEHTMPVC